MKNSCIFHGRVFVISCDFKSASAFEQFDKLSLFSLRNLWSSIGYDQTCHYANMPMQYAAIFKSYRNDNYLMKTIYLIFAKNLKRKE